MAGPLEALRSSSGTAFASDLSGQFSSCGIALRRQPDQLGRSRPALALALRRPLRRLDDKATGSVRWQSLPGEASAARGGGWLETRSRAWGYSDAVHGSAKLGFVAGSVATWGRQGDWGWQLGVQRTWQGAALDHARDNGWSDQEMDAGFTDGSAALSCLPRAHGNLTPLDGYLCQLSPHGIDFPLALAAAHSHKY